MLDTSTDLLYVNGRTILAKRKYLNDINATIRLDNMYVQNKRRKHDISIMDMIAKQTIYKVTEKQKERINCVRMFLGVQFLSKICTVNGDAFAPGIMDGKMKDDDIDNLIYRTKLSTPIQPKPNTYSWKKWSKLLSTLTTRSSTTRLQQKLGKWY